MDNTAQKYADGGATGTRVDGMATSPAHARPGPKDYLWVLALVAACALIKVSPSWVGIGAAAGFPRFGRMPTDWTLAVIMEAYWGYALYAWLAAAPGVRSRRFAMWSAAGVFALSLAGQSSARLVGVKAMTAFANGMPVIVLALIALLVHLRQLDRADAVQAAEAANKGERARAEAAAAADERTALRAQLEAARAALEPLQAGLATAREEFARVTEKAETLERKLAAATARKRAAATGRKSGSATGRKREPVTGPATAPEETADVDKEALVLKYLAEGHSASEAGKLAGLSDSRGRQIARKLATAAPKGQDETEGP